MFVVKKKEKTLPWERLWLRKKEKDLLWERCWEWLHVKNLLCGNIDGKKKETKNGNFFLKWKQNPFRPTVLLFLKNFIFGRMLPVKSNIFESQKDCSFKRS